MRGSHEGLSGAVQQAILPRVGFLHVGVGAVRVDVFHQLPELCLEVPERVSVLEVQRRRRRREQVALLLRQRLRVPPRLVHPPLEGRVEKHRPKRSLLLGHRQQGSLRVVSRRRHGRLMRHAAQALTEPCFSTRVGRRPQRRHRLTRREQHDPDPWPQLPSRRCPCRLRRREVHFAPQHRRRHLLWPVAVGAGDVVEEGEGDW
mmetsp:Transcript_13335/g.31262  ORF Transcript_13335/g.31262 Transcript_13335/m.31262 type:complete len:203 (-) Transcript_13335:158-766(-)